MVGATYSRMLSGLGHVTVTQVFIYIIRYGSATVDPPLCSSKIPFWLFTHIQEPLRAELQTAAYVASSNQANQSLTCVRAAFDGVCKHLHHRDRRIGTYAANEGPLF